MRGILPATIGLSLATGVRMARPLLTQARQEGPMRLSAHIVVAAGAAVLMATGKISPVFILLLAGVVTLLLMMAVPVEAGAVKNEGPS
jgi:chromate transport protein ChrA